MNKGLTLAAAMLLATAAFCFAQTSKTPADYIREFPSRSGSNHHTYEYTDLSDTPAPKGYKAVYISHYGRHGSRSDFSGDGWKGVVSTLTLARDNGLLNAKGEEILAGAIKVCEVSDGKYEMLTKVGVEEHKGIGRRMYQRFPSVFKGSKSVFAESSTSQRCIVSMGSFACALAACNPKLDIELTTGKRYMDYIGKTEGYHEATDGTSQMLKAFSKTLPVDSLSFLNAIFTDPEAAHALIGSAAKLQSNILNTAGFAGCFGVDTDFYSILPFQTYYNDWRVKCRHLYLRHCNSVEFGDRRVPIARDLVMRIIANADEELASVNGPAAHLRFGHDYPLLALVSYLGLEGVGGRYSFDQIEENWPSYFYICMASNLQLIWYRNTGGELLVKCLYNEKETLFPDLTPVQGPYYRWDELRSYWLNRYPQSNS